MNSEMLLMPIVVPLCAMVLLLLLPKRSRVIDCIVILATAANLALSVLLFKSRAEYVLPWLGSGFEFSLRANHISNFILLASSFFAFLAGIYSCVFVRGKDYAKQFHIYFLISVAFVAGAVLADNLLVMLFFWEGLLITLFAMIAIGNSAAFKTATKAFIIVGISDLCMMVGIALAGILAGTLSISKISLASDGIAGVAFLLLAIGAIAKAGSMPFHSWIPNAAVDAPLPFMALFPAALEKLVGIYFLARVSLEMFRLVPGSWASVFLMVIGVLTILFAVAMALIQKDYKKLLAYHAVSQVGYMVLGIGSLVPAGIIGGLFHMINNALYKSCLFFSAGAVERQAGTTNLAELGGLRRKMPVTFVYFIIAAAAISGVWPLNGFFSKELVYEGALQHGWVLYAAALVGSFLTAASFLKLAHAAFFGKLSEKNSTIKEAPMAMLFPMAVIAGVCILFGVLNFIPLKYFIEPMLGHQWLAGHHGGGVPANFMLIAFTVVVLCASLLNHWFGFKKSGSGLHAADHLRSLPLVSWIYAKAEQGYFDPYNVGFNVVKTVSWIAWGLDRAVDFIYDGLSVGITLGLSKAIRKLHTGNQSLYILWSLIATVTIVIYFLQYQMPRVNP